MWDVSRSKTVVRDTGESTSNDKMTEPVVEEEKMAPILLGAKDRIDADDQTAGSLVNILTIQLERAGWVAVHEDNNGELAQKFFKKGLEELNIKAEDLRFSGAGVKDVVKHVFLPWFNAYRFLI